MTQHVRSDDTGAAVRRLRDESEIRAVIDRLARGIDRSDFDLVRRCYHDDATEAHGHYNGHIDGYIEYSRGRTTIESITHLQGQTLIELDGDAAWVESYCLCLIRTLPEDGKAPADLVANVRYVDLFERRDDAWRIVHRKVIHSPTRLDAVDVIVPLAEQAFLARPDQNDPSYDRRAESFLP